MKVLVAGLAAFVAGVGGALLAIDIGVARPSSYAALFGLIWLAVLVTLGIRSTVAALLAGVTFTILPALTQVYLAPDWSLVPPVLFGLGAIVLAKYPEGSLAMNARQFRSFVGRLSARSRRDPGERERVHDELSATVGS
jgi:branched-chain amino acid transport system permease protein